ncbi:MAG TPA: hypothetical protein VGJ15_07985 [Pirellulales bacterium]
MWHEYHDAVDKFLMNALFLPVAAGLFWLSYIISRRRFTLAEVFAFVTYCGFIAGYANVLSFCTYDQTYHLLNAIAGIASCAVCAMTGIRIGRELRRN